MRKFLLKLCLIICVICHATASAYADPYLVSSDTEFVTVNDDFPYTEIINGAYAGTMIMVDTSSSSTGVIASGVSTPAISIESSGSLSSLTIVSGTVSSQNADSSSGTVSLVGDSGTTPIITVGNDSGTSGTISNSGSGNAIYAESASTSLTIENKATGTISSVGTALNLIDASNLSSLTLTNAGSISASDYAIYLDGYSADITNSGTISGNIYTNSDSALSITNTAGEISGDIDLGINTGSIITLNGGKISGNVTMRDDSQLFIFNGGNLDGSSIDGYSGSGTSAGTVRIDANTTLHGFIGENNAVSFLRISDGVSFNFNGNSSNVGKIILGAAATLNDTYGDITTDEIDGSDTNEGIFNLTFGSAGTFTLNTLIGTDNGLEQFNITGNIGSGTETAATIILAQSLNVSTTKIEGAHSILRLGSNNTINGNVEIGNNATFQMDDASAVSGTIQGVAQYNGTLVIRNSIGGDSVSQVTLQNEIGDFSHDLAAVIGEHATVLDAATNNVSINAQNIYLYSLAHLNIGSGSVNGNIKGLVDSGSSNGFGDVTFYNSNTLGGNVGSHNGNALNSVSINDGLTVTADSFEINATTITLGNDSALTSSALISGGDNDDSGATYKDAAILLSASAALTLSADSAIFASIDGAGHLIIDDSNTLNSSNSRLNIGASTNLSLVQLNSNAVLDLSGNNGALKADKISLADGSTLKVGNGEINGSIYSSSLGGDSGTLDIQGNATLDNAIGSSDDGSSLHLINVGASDSSAFSVSALNSITATSITINGSGSSFSIADSKSINGSVTIGDGAQLSVGVDSSVNGAITGSSQYNGILNIRSGATFAPGANIGAGSLDLAQIKINGTFDLSGLSGYDVHSQVFSLTNGGTLIIGAGVVDGTIKGTADDGGATDGFGKGSVSFAANSSSFAGNMIGTNDGYAIHELSVGANLIVDTNTADISAERITLYSGASLTSSASSISGGDQISGGFSRLNTTITLNDGASLTLNNIDKFLGTIDGNEAGQGSLTLTGSYVYDDGDDAIDIGGTNKLSSITLADSSSLDGSRWNGIVKADAITLNDSAVLTVGSGNIVGTVNSNFNENGKFNILGTATLSGAIGGTHKLAELNIGNSTHFLGVTANNSIVADSVTLTSTSNPGEITSLTLSANHSITGNVTLRSNTKLYLGDSSYVDGTIHGHGELNILANSVVSAYNNIGGGGDKLASIGINDGARLDLGGYNLTSDSISLIDSAQLVIGDGAVNGDILSYGSGTSRVIFSGSANSLNGNIGNNSGNAVSYTYVSGGGKSLDTNGFSIYTSNFIVASSSNLTVSGIIAGGLDNSDSLTGTNLTLNGASTLTLSSGASVFGTVNGINVGAPHTGTIAIADNVSINSNISIGNSMTVAAVNLGTSSTLDLSAHNNILKANSISLANGSNLILGSGAVAGVIDGSADDNRGKVSAVSSATFGAGVTFGSTHGLNEIDFGNNSGATINVTNSIAAVTTKIIGPATFLNLGDAAQINGDVVIDGDSTLTLGNGSVVNGTITNLSDSTPNSNLVIRTNAAVTSNGNIGGGGYNFGLVLLQDSSSLNLNTHSNSISASLVQISDDATLTIGNATVNAEIQGHNSGEGSNYGLGKVVFADDNTLGGYVGVDTGATLESVTINAGKNVDGNAQRIAALDIILEDGATLTNSGSISAGSASESGTLQNSHIKLGDDAILKLSEIEGEATLATIDGVDTNSQGKLQILSGSITAYADIGNTHSLAAVSLAEGSTLNLVSTLDETTHNAVLKAANIYLGSDSTLAIGTNSVTGNISGHADSGSNNDLGSVIFNGATNSLAGNVGGHNDNALANVTINTGNSVTAGSHEINAATINLSSYSTLTSSGAISGGADITGSTPVATAISLNANAILVLNSGSSIFGTIDGASDSADGMGAIEFVSDFITNGDIGSIHKLASVIVDDTANLDLGTHGNSLNATTLYLGTDSTLTLGDAGTVSAAISSLSADSGVVYLNDSVTLDSGSTLGGSSGLLSLYIDNAGSGNVAIDSQDSIKARNVNINGFRSALNLAANETITGNVSLGDGSRLRLYDGASVTGTIDSVEDSGGSLRISGDVTTQSNIGNSHNLGSLTLDDGATLRLNVNDNILKSDSITLGSGSNFIVGDAQISGIFLGSADGNGTVTFTADNTIASGTKLGDVMALGATTTIGNVVISDGATVTQNTEIASTAVTINEGGTLIVASGTAITSNHITLGGTLIVNDSSNLSANLQGDSGTGELVINDNATFSSTHYLGGDDDLHLNKITLRTGSTLDLATNNNSANASDIILYNNSTLNIRTATVSGTIQGNSQGKGSVNFYGSNDLGGDLGADAAALHNITIASSMSGNTVDTQGHAIYATGDITLGTNATLITSSSITGGSADDVASIKMGSDSTLTLNNGALVLGTINGALDDSAGVGTVDIASGSVTLNGDIGDVYKIATLTIEDGATLDAATNPSSINAASIAVGDGSTLSVTSTSSSGGDFGLNGVVDGVGTVSLAASSSYNFDIHDYNTYALNATLGSSDTLTAVNFNLNTAYLSINNSLKADSVSVSGTNGYLILAANKNISGDVFINSATLNLKNGSSVSGTITTADDGRGVVIVGSNIFGPGGATSTVVAQSDIGTSDTTFGTVALSDNTTLNLATHTTNIYTHALSIGNNSSLQIGGGSVTASDSFSMNSNSTVSISSGTINGSVGMLDGSSITISGSGGIHGDVSGNGDITFSANNYLYGKVGKTSSNNAEINRLTLSDGVSLTSSYEIAAKEIVIGSGSGTATSLITSAKISGGYDGTSTLSSAITLGDGGVLQLNNGSHSIASVTANINGLSAGDGELDIAGDISGNINIGNSAKISGLNIASASSLNVSTNNNSVNATNINFAQTASLTIGTTTLNSKLDGTSNDYGTFNIASNKTATTNGDIGSSHSLKAVNINAGATLNIAAHNNLLNATNTTLGNGATLNVGSGAISGNFLGAASGNGTVIFNNSATLNSDTVLGLDTHELNTVTIANGVNITTSTLISALHTNIGTTGMNASSLSYAATNGDNIIGDISIAAQGTLNLTNSGFVSIGAIDGKADNAGTVNISGSGDLTLNEDIGETHTLSALNIGDGILLNSYTNGASISAQNIYLGVGTSLVMAGGALLGTVHGAGNSDEINFIGSTSHSLSGDLGVASDSHGIDNISLDGTLNAGSHGIRTNNFIFNDIAAVLNFGSGNIDITNFTNNNSGSGIMNFAANNSINFAIGSSDEIAELNVANGATINANQTIYATNTTIGNGSSGKLILAAIKSLHSDVLINSGANLTLNNGSSIIGNINGASSSGSGTLEVNGSASITGNIGSGNKISALTLNSGAILNIASGTTNAAIASSSGSGKIELASGATFALQNGSAISNEISGASAGYGNITAAGAVSFGTIGATNSINNLTTASGSSATFGGNIFANGDVNINGAAIFSNATTEISASTFNVNSGSTLSLSINLNSAPTNILDITGAAMLSSNTILNLTISGSATSGTTINLINASAPSTLVALDASKININNSNSNIRNSQTFSTSVLDNQLLLTIIGNFTPDVVNFSNQNLQNTYDAIVNISDATGNLSIIQDYITNGSNSTSQKEAALDSASPQVDNSANRISFNSTSNSLNLTSERISSLRGISSGENNMVKSAWAQAFGAMVNQGNTPNSQGYKAGSYGFAGGFDHEISDDVISGLSFSYTNSDISARDNLKKTRVDSYQFNLYASKDFDKFFLNSMAGLAMNKYSAHRSIPLASASAHADYWGQTYIARLEAGKNIKLKNDFIFTPIFALTASRNKISDYSEKGAGTLNLAVNNRDSDFFEARFGSEIGKDFAFKNGKKIHPAIFASYGYDLAGNKQHTSARFVGQSATFESSAGNIAQGSLKIGTGVKFYHDNFFSMNLDYSFEQRSDYHAHYGSLKAKYEF